MTRRFGALLAADRVSLEVGRGEMFGLIGPDGAGKTTTLRTVLGLLAPSAGRVRTCGLEPVRQRRALSHRVGYLSQRFSLYGDLTVDENIEFFTAVHDVKDHVPLREELLDLVRLTPFRGRLADRLSGGMKQKLALACTLIHTPELLVLDEPTTGVDPVSRREFWKLLARLQRRGLTILLTTPYLDEAERCTRVALMHEARLLVVDTPDALRALGHPALVEVLARPRAAAQRLAAAFPGASEVEVFGERLHVAFAGRPPQDAEVLAVSLGEALRGAGLEVETSAPLQPSLEDVFIRRIREAA